MDQVRTRNSKVCHQCHSRKVAYIDGMSVLGSNIGRSNATYKIEKMAHAAIVEKQIRYAGRFYRSLRDECQVLMNVRPRLSVRQRALQGDMRQPTQSDEPTPTKSSTGSVGFLGEESYLRNASVPDFVDDTLAETAEMREKIVQVTGATVPPPKMVIAALGDVYFDHIYPQYPLVDRADLVHDASSPLLLLSLCLVGASYGHRRASKSQISMANQYYLKVKTLLDVEQEKDNVIVLKALCLLTCRSVKLPTQVCLESNWHWQGVAVRYAIHMGLHKESTYAGRQDGGSCRRLWWHLFVRAALSLSRESHPNPRRRITIR